MTREIPNANVQGGGPVNGSDVFRLFLTVDGRKDEQEFVGFLPYDSCGFGLGRTGLCYHTQPVFGLLRLLLAGAYLVHELLSRYRLISLSIIGPNAGSGTNDLADQRLGDAVFGQAAAKRNHLLPEQRSAFGEIKLGLASLFHPVLHTPNEHTKSRLSLVIGIWSLVISS
jgi:hypothetical protein